VEIITLPVGQMRANCYLVVSKETSECIIIDPGDEAEFITQKVLDWQLAPTLIVATHGHFDHIGAVLALKLNFGVPFYMHKKDAFLLGRLRKTQIRFAGTDPGPPPTVDGWIKGGDEVKIKNCKLKIITAAGHTPGSIALVSGKDKVAFTGDLVFADGSTGRTDFKYANKSLLNSSIDKIEKLTGYTLYPGHGDACIMS